uniref:H92D n=1 Tax=Human herpesvirus 6B TaxID=32604 RepID=O57156_HHV6H|nr:H92D [Human betaherpesvirus 6B]
MRTSKSANGGNRNFCFSHKVKDQWVPRLGSFLPRLTRTLKSANGATAVPVFLIKLKVSGYRG